MLLYNAARTLRPGRQRLGPFVGTVAAPIPTISCAGISGDPDSYLYDPFDDNRGWWNLTFSSPNTQITNGYIRPVSPNFATTYNYLKSANPTGAQVVTSIATFRGQWESGFTYHGNHGFGKSGTVFRVGMGVLTGDLTNLRFFVTQTAATPSVAGALYSEVMPDPQLIETSHVFKVEVTATQAKFYLDEVLKYTHGATIDMTVYEPSILTAFLSATRSYFFCEDYVLFGYTLPVHC